MDGFVSNLLSSDVWTSYIKHAKEVLIMHAIVLAGYDAKEPLSQHFQVEAKALVPLAGKPMVAYVLETLRSSHAISQIIYVGLLHPQLEGLYDVQLEPSPHILENLKNGITQAQQKTASAMFIISADLAWLDAVAVDAFIEKSQECDAALLYAVIAAEQVRQQFPEQKHRQFARVQAEGSSSKEFTGGSVLYLRPEAISPLLTFAERAYRARKNLLALARILGFQLTMQFLSRNLKIVDVERRVSTLLTVDARALPIQHANLAIDVDTLEEHAHAERDLKEHGS